MAVVENNEVWKVIDEYDDYDISSHGRTRNNKTEKIFQPDIRYGYHNVMFCKNGKTKRYNIHHLVCSTFCHNPNKYKIVEHIDSNILNNMFNNLRWVYTSKNSLLRTKSKHDIGEIYGVTGNNEYSWRARWCDNEGILHCSKSFSVKIYGRDQAKNLAIALRKAKELEFGYL